VFRNGCLCCTCTFYKLAIIFIEQLLKIEIILCTVLIRWLFHLPVVLEVAFTCGTVQNKKAQKCHALGKQICSPLPNCSPYRLGDRMTIDNY